MTLEKADEPPPGLILPNGDINWNCPCLGGMAVGPCGLEFREAFSCFHYSKSEVKGSECLEQFAKMQMCMKEYPELYEERKKEGEEGEVEEGKASEDESQTSESKTTESKTIESQTSESTTDRPPPPPSEPAQPAEVVGEVSAVTDVKKEETEEEQRAP